MVLSLNIPDDKVAFFMELLQHFPYIKVENISVVEDLLREQNYQVFDEAEFRMLAEIIDKKENH